SRVPRGASNCTRLFATSIASCAFVAKTIRSKVPGTEYSANGATSPASMDNSPPMPMTRRPEALISSAAVAFRVAIETEAPPARRRAPMTPPSDPAPTISVFMNPCFVFLLELHRLLGRLCRTGGPQLGNEEHQLLLPAERS